MTLKFSFTEKVVALQIIHEARRMLWDYLVIYLIVKCTPRDSTFWNRKGMFSIIRESINRCRKCQQNTSREPNLHTCTHVHNVHVHLPYRRPYTVCSIHTRTETVEWCEHESTQSKDWIRDQDRIRWGAGLRRSYHLSSLRRAESIANVN